ncbi:uncharacterized protein TNCV_2888641 [Trichonephila clavipes]|nr:uncharacterized protein TNCV_2888641 [Trichonephila clavipes]
MGITNYHGTWGRKPRLIRENCNNSSRRKEDVPDEEGGQTNGGIYINRHKIPYFPTTRPPRVAAGEVLVNTHQNVGFIHDSTPAHLSTSVRNHRHAASYSGRCIERGEPVSWPQRFLHLNPMDFSFWSHLKLLVYERSRWPQRRIHVASADVASTPDLFEHVRQYFFRCCRLCYNLCG